MKGDDTLRKCVVRNEGIVFSLWKVVVDRVRLELEFFGVVCEKN